MHLHRYGVLALGATAVGAFQDTSPFIFASTSEFPTKSSQLKSATSVVDDLWGTLNSCPSDYYVVVLQPGVHATDFTGRKSAPRLRSVVKGDDELIKSTYTVTEVAGMVDPRSIRDALKDQCAVQVTEIDGSTQAVPTDLGSGPRLIDVTFPVLSLGPNRARELRENDKFLANLVDRVPSKKYTLIYVTSPKELEEIDEGSMSYSFDDNMFQEPFHSELKRDFSDSVQAEDDLDSSSLFRKYQFFTPGIFMGAIALFVFLTILYVGISALLSLKVSYAAFEKDTAPGTQGQKKQQ